MSENELNTPDQIPENAVFDMLEFASALTGGSMYPSVLTPLLLNQRLKELNLSPLQATENDLMRALASPRDSEIQLQGYSQDFEISSQPYKRLLAYLSNMLSFDFSYTCINAKPEDYTGKAYQKDLDQVKKFFDRFDYKKEFNIAVSEMLRSEAFFCCARFDDDQIALQEMNSSPLYTLITGRSAMTLLYSFNMYFFLQPGTDLNLFPPFFTKKFNDMFSGKTNLTAYDPALALGDRGNSTWVFWQDIPVGKDPYGWCFKFNPEIVTRLPYFTGMFSDLVQQNLIRALQKSVFMANAVKLVSGEIPMLKDTAAKVKDQFSLTPGTLGNFLAYVKAAIGDALKTIALPLTNVKTLEFSAQDDMYPSYLRNLVAMSGVNSNLIFTNQNRTNAIESMLSIGIDEQLMTKLYPQFGSFCSFHINNSTKNFKFKINFEGTSNYTNRQQRFDRIIQLTDRGIILNQQMAASIGMSPFDFQRQLEESQSTKWVDKLTPILMSGQMSGKEDNGRPQKSDSEIGDSGVETKSSGGNIEKGGKV